MDSAFSGIRGIWVLVLFVTLDPSLWGEKNQEKRQKKPSPKFPTPAEKKKNLSPAPQPFFCEGYRRKEDGKGSPNTKVFLLPQSLSLPTEEEEEEKPQGKKVCFSGSEEDDEEEEIVCLLPSLLFRRRLKRLISNPFPIIASGQSKGITWVNLILSLFVMVAQEK